jgi:uncharacterized protein YciI
MTELPPKWVLFYESSDRVGELAPIHFPAHASRLEQFRNTGELLLVGTFADPVVDGSMSVFTSRDAAERFVAHDPFVVHGVVARWTLKQWNEMLMTA